MGKYNIGMTDEPSTIPGMIMGRIAHGSSVLEFGPAEGRMTRYMSEKLGCKVSIVEYDMNSFCVAMKYAEDGICADIETGTWKEYFARKTFDYIVFADVLEHLRNPSTVLSDTRQFLKTGGEVIVSIPNIAHNDILVKLFYNSFDYTETGLLDNTHIHFWGKNNLDEFANQAGYSIEILDGVYLSQFETEQFPKELDIPFHLRFALAERSYNDVYQFLAVLREKKWAEENSIQTTDLVKQFSILAPGKKQSDDIAPNETDCHNEFAKLFNEDERIAKEKEQLLKAIDEKDRAVRKLKTQLYEEKKQYETICAAYNSISQSKFWRVTAPIRKVLDAIKNVSRHFRL